MRASQRVYVTNLYNLALPFIRFEVTNEVTVARDAAMMIGEALAAGLEQLDVTITQAAVLDRQTSGKLKRFIPLPGR